MQAASETYVEMLSQMADLDAQSAGASRPKKWNRLVDRLQEARKKLATSDEGRATITALLDDSRATVRLWAAGHALFWDEPRAREVLTVLSNDRTAGLNQLNAEMTLREFDAGRLKSDW